jgi:hypothetical protein
MQEGDIITHLDGRSLTTPIPDEEEMEFGEGSSLPVQRLLALARDLEDGQEVEIRFIRDGEAMNATVEAAEMDDRWVTVLPRGRRGGMLHLGPEGRLRWRYFLPDEDFDFHIAPGVEVWKDLEDLHIEIPEFHFEGFPSDTLPGFRVWRGEAPNVLFYRGGGDDFTFEFLGRSRVHGLDLRELNAGLAEYFSTDRGLLVLDVDEDSRLGLRAGDVILSIGDRPVQDTRDVYRILGSYEKEEAVSFTVMRQGRELRVEGSIG